MAKLTPKQQRFVEEYLVDLNATQAAIKDKLYNPNKLFDANTQFCLIVGSLCVLLSENIKDYLRKKACMLILKYYLPNWEVIFNDACAPFSRHDKRVIEWKKAVLQNNGYKCALCGSADDIEAHHIVPWADYPPGRVDINNGITLCNSCHAEQHIQEYQLIKNRSGKRCSA